VAEVVLPVLPLASTLRGHLQPLLHSVVQGFREATGVELVPETKDELATEPATVLLLLTGGTEEAALEVAEASAKPVVLLSHGRHNSLPAALETAARLQQLGRNVALVHLGSDWGVRLPALARAVALARNLRGKRLGVLGDPSPWLVASPPHTELLAQKLGMELRFYSLAEFLPRVPAQAKTVAEGPAQGVGDEERVMGARVQAALEEFVRDQGLSGVTVACFGLLGHGMTACWALARLADCGTPAGCEGDVPALLALILAQELTGGPGFLANPADVDLKRERIVLAHCTVPLTLTQGHTLRTHFESGIGLAVAGDVRPGPYTLVRLGGERLERGFFVEGTVLPERLGREDLCRTQVVFKMPKGAIEKMLENPLGNHHVLIPGHHRAVLAAFHRLFLAESP